MFAIREPSLEAMRAAPVKFRFGSNKRLVLVDQFTASAVLSLHAAVNADNQAKIERMVKTPHGLTKIAGFALSKTR